MNTKNIMGFPDYVNPAIADESTADLMGIRAVFCYETLNSPGINFAADYLQEKAIELRDITNELIKRGAITGTPKPIADTLARFELKG